jgi:hypothetical protein
MLLIFTLNSGNPIELVFDYHPCTLILLLDFVVPAYSIVSLSILGFHLDLGITTIVVLNISTIVIQL